MNPLAAYSPMLRIHHVQGAIENAYGGGHRRFGVQENDREIAAPYHGRLTGCSDEAFNTIVFPLRGVYESLSSDEKTVESWAFKAKRMDFRRGCMQLPFGTIMECIQWYERGETFFLGFGISSSSDQVGSGTGESISHPAATRPPNMMILL